MSQRTGLMLLGIVACVSTCNAGHGTEGEAIEMARDEAILDSRQIKGHVLIIPSRLETRKVERTEDGGWSITLVQDECTYIVYADPGHELDVTGVSAGCFSSEPTPSSP